MKDLYFYEYLNLNTLKKKGQKSESIFRHPKTIVFGCVSYLMTIEHKMLNLTKSIFCSQTVCATFSLK